MKKYIYSMSKSRRDIGADLEQGCDELILHLIKLRMYPQAQECSHWRKEVAEKLHRVDSFKGTRRLPNVSFIMQNTFNVHEHRISKYIHIAEVDYDYDAITFDKDILVDDIRDYFKWIATELQDDGRLAYTDIISYLETNGF